MKEIWAMELTCLLPGLFLAGVRGDIEQEHVWPTLEQSVWRSVDWTLGEGGLIGSEIFETFKGEP